jgi:hypothetical protein
MAVLLVGMTLSRTGSYFVSVCYQFCKYEYVPVVRFVLIAIQRPTVYAGSKLAHVCMLSCWNYCGVPTC